MDEIIWMMIGLLEMCMRMMLMVFTGIILPVCGFLLNLIFGIISEYPIAALVTGLVVAGGFLLAAIF